MPAPGAARPCGARSSPARGIGHRLVRRSAGSCSSTIEYRESTARPLKPNCGTPPCSGTGATGCNAGPNVSGACSTTATTGNPATSNTSQDCPPEAGMGVYQGALSVDLNPLTTSSVSLTSATGFFCTGQTHAGAFGQTGTRCITEAGSPAGNLTDGAPHAAVEATVFCIPATNNGTL